MRLRKFRARAFRCIHDSGDITIGDLAAFIGRNESGKTTILQALMLLNVDEIISELDLCDEMTDVLKSEIRIIEGEFGLIEEETEMIKEKFPHLDIKKLNIFRTNKNSEIQYDFGDITISQEEDKSMDKSCCEDCGLEFEELYEGFCQYCADDIPNFPEDTLAWLFVASTLKNNPELVDEIDKLLFYLWRLPPGTWPVAILGY